MWYLIVSIPDLCTLTYFVYFCYLATCTCRYTLISASARGNPPSGFATRSCSHQPALLQRLARILLSRKRITKTLMHKLVCGCLKISHRLMQVKSIAECSKGSILQYFQPLLSYHLSLRSLFCLFLVAV